MNADRDPDGVIRRAPLVSSVAGILTPSLGLEMLRLAASAPGVALHLRDRRVQGVVVGPLSIPTQADGTVWLRLLAARSGALRLGGRRAGGPDACGPLRPEAGAARCHGAGSGRRADHAARPHAGQRDPRAAAGERARGSPGGAARLDRMARAGAHGWLRAAADPRPAGPAVCAGISRSPGWCSPRSAPSASPPGGASAGSSTWRLPPSETPRCSSPCWAARSPSTTRSAAGCAASSRPSASRRRSWKAS